MQQNHNTLVIPLQRNQISQLKIMDELTEIYKRIEYLRNNGVKMKEIADRIDMAPSVLSALYSSVLPAYIDLLKTRTPDEALDDSLASVNNVSKKRLLNNVASMKLLLQEMEPEQQSEAESGIISNHQNSYLMFNERDLPQFALVTIYLQLPHYEFPNMLKGLYLCLDYNHNPIARRIVMVKQSDSTDTNEFLKMEGRLVPKAELTPELEVYYNYTCQEGDYIKTCTVPSPKLDETDLEREKKLLMI